MVSEEASVVSHRSCVRHAVALLHKLSGASGGTSAGGSKDACFASPQSALKGHLNRRQQSPKYHAEIPKELRQGKNMAKRTQAPIVSTAEACNAEPIYHVALLLVKL